LSPARPSNSSWGTLRHSPTEPGDIIPSLCSGSSLGPLPRWTCLDDLPREMTRVHPY
ncbi:hypothetical protein LDENG_00200470, partial [Lucifuga dentata]